MRIATDALIDSLRLSPSDRRERLRRAAKKIAYYQARNAQARKSHTRTRLKLLAKRGIHLDALRCCIPPDG